MQTESGKRAPGVFEKRNLKNMDENGKVLRFEVHMHPKPGEQGIEDLKSALQELDDLGIAGVVGPYPVAKIKMGS